MESLSFYLETATKAVYKWGPSGMRSDEDAISDVASAIMFADKEFDGRGDLSGYRMYRARCAILNLIKSYKRRQAKGPVYSLDEGMNSDSEESKFLNYDTFIVKESEDNVEDLINNAPITEMQKYCIERYYLYNDTYEEIARQTGFSREKIRYDIIDTIRFLREHYGES